MTFPLLHPPPTAPRWTGAAEDVHLLVDDRPLQALERHDQRRGPVLVLTGNRCPQYLQWLRELGWSVLVDTWAPDMIERAARRTEAGGQVYVGPDLHDAPRLCPRERLVLYAAAQGLDNHEIGRALTISVKSVANVLSEVLDVLHLRNRVQAALYFRGHWRDLSGGDGPDAPLPTLNT